MYALPVEEDECKSNTQSIGVTQLKHLGFAETIKLVTDFSQELRKQVSHESIKDLLRPSSLLSVAIKPKVDQKRFLLEDSPILVCVKNIESGVVHAEELSRDIKLPQVFSFSEEEFSLFPIDCPYFFANQKLYEEFCLVKSVVPFPGFRTLEDMRTFHCGFWLNLTAAPPTNPNI